MFVLFAVVMESAEAAELPDYPMIKVQAGSFIMGSPVTEPGRLQVEPQRTVTIPKAFLIGATEVTQDLWVAVMGSNPSWFKACGGACPVEQISWCDAVYFSNRFSQISGYSPAYQLPQGFERTLGDKGGAYCVQEAGKVKQIPGSNGYRLPTAAEWEFAARVGQTTPLTEAELHWVAWYDGNAGGTTHPVATKRPTVIGLYDVFGNVGEWTWNSRADLVEKWVDSPGDPIGKYRVSKGSSYSDNYGTRPPDLLAGLVDNYEQRHHRVAWWRNDPPSARWEWTGCRLVRTSQ